MPVLKLSEIKEFPVYVEHFSKFYLVGHPITEEGYIPCVSGEGVSLRVLGSQKYNVFTEKEYKGILEAKLKSLEGNKPEAQKSVSDNSVTSEVVEDAKANAKAALTSQLSSLKK